LRLLSNRDPSPLVERSVDRVVVRDVSVLRGAVGRPALTGPATCSDPPGVVAPPGVLFLRSLMRRASELPREPAATDEPVVLLSVNDSAVCGGEG
jgi:hypothetical protein